MTPPNEQARETPMAELAERLSPQTRENLKSGRLLSMASVLDLALTDTNLLNRDCDGLSVVGLALRSHLMGGSDRGK